MFSQNFVEFNTGLVRYGVSSPWHISLRFGLWREECWKYWAELTWNIASLFGRQTVSVSCS